MKKRFLGLLALTGLITICGCSSDSNYSPSIAASEPAKVYIVSVTAFPVVSESITLRNNSGEAVDISGWTLGNSASQSSYVVPDGVVMKQGATQTFPHSVLNFLIGDSGETLFLKDKTGANVDSWHN